MSTFEKFFDAKGDQDEIYRELLTYLHRKAHASKSNILVVYNPYLRSHTKLDLLECHYLELRQALIGDEEEGYDLSLYQESDASEEMIGMYTDEVSSMLLRLYMIPDAVMTLNYIIATLDEFSLDNLQFVLEDELFNLGLLSEGLQLTIINGAMNTSYFDFVLPCSQQTIMSGMITRSAELDGWELDLDSLDYEEATDYIVQEITSPLFER